MPDKTASVTPSDDSSNSNLNTNIAPFHYGMQSIKDDIGLMMNYAINKGKELPNNLILSNEITDPQLLSNYNNLQKVIAPATVQSIRYINSQWILKNQTRKWYQVPIFTKCVMIAGLALVTIILISLSPEVNEENQIAGLLAGSGLTLLLNLTFICSASLLGVMFYLLKTFGDKIRNYTLLPVNSVELNASIIIGVISGFVISELFTYTISSIGSQNVEIHKMTLAMLGGFSSDAIFSTLQGVVNKFKSLLTT